MSTDVFSYLLHFSQSAELSEVRGSSVAVAVVLSVLKEVRELIGTMMNALLVLAVLWCGLQMPLAVIADTPANCTLEDVVGEWIFYEGRISSDPNLDCSQIPNVQRKIAVTLNEDYALERNWTRGSWTMVYNQGFQVFLNFRSFFAFFQYRQDGKKVTSLCDYTFVGRSHDVTLRNYACFFAKKKNSVQHKVHQHPFIDHPLLEEAKPMDRAVHESLVAHINKKQSSWKAAVHEPFVHMTPKQILLLSGGPRSWLPAAVKAVPRPYLEKDSMDWRNISGENFLSPVRNQGSCGSCYAFSSVGMMEARLRLYTRNQQQPILSPQDIVSCTALAQGCSGGFPYLIAGKYGRERGLVGESCNPYAGTDEACVRESCQRWYTAEYGYVGGRYGRCSEEGMVAALRNGPLSVSFNVYPDFMHYKSGIYHYTGPNSNFSQFIPVNHAVLLVGYGVDGETGEKFWTIKNSWGENWGEEGYFRIRRGVDEVGVESIAVEAFPIPV